MEDDLLQFHDKTKSYTFSLYKNTTNYSVLKHLTKKKSDVFFIYSVNKNTSYSPNHKDLKFEVYPNNFLVSFEDQKNLTYLNVPPKAVVIIIKTNKINIDGLPESYKNNETIISILANKPTLYKTAFYGKVKENIEQILFSLNQSHFSLFSLKSYIYNLIDNSFLFLTQLNEFKNNENSIKDKINLIHNIIIARQSNPPSLNELSLIVGLNLKLIKSEFKKEYGSPVFTYLLNHKMRLAKDLLLAKELNINEISTFLGYSTSSHFIFAFKKKFEITPKQFQKKLT